MLLKKRVDWSDLDIRRRDGSDEEIKQKDKEGLWMLLWSLLKVVGLIGVTLWVAYFLIFRL